MNDPLDLRCIQMDAEMEMSRYGDECIKKVKNPSNPCGMCKEYGFCFKAPAGSLKKSGDDI